VVSDAGINGVVYAYFLFSLEVNASQESYLVHSPLTTSSVRLIASLSSSFTRYIKSGNRSLTSGCEISSWNYKWREGEAEEASFLLITTITYNWQGKRTLYAAKAAMESKSKTPILQDTIRSRQKFGINK
jgi:hypothetical protein